MLIPVTYAAGTNKSRQHTKITTPAFTDTDHVHFQEDGRLATIPPYAASSVTGIKGKCRSVYAQRITIGNEGDYYLFGTHSHLYAQIGGVLHNITPIKSGSGTTLGSDPIATTNGNSVVVVTHTAHGFASGDRIAMSGIAGALSGIPQAKFNKEHIVTRLTADTYSIDTGTNASATSAGVGGSAVVIKGQMAAGNSLMETSGGMGVGDYGAGSYGAGGISATGLLTYPRIWSFGAFGGEIVMCAGDYAAGDGQKIYIWDGDTDVAPSALSGAPTDCNWVSVINNSIVALCGDTIKICLIGDGTVWSGFGYYENKIQRIDRLHSMWAFGQKDAVIHHEGGALLLRYTGDADIWDVSDLMADDDGVVSPQSCVSINGALVWRGRKAFYLYDGGASPRIIDNTQNLDWILSNVSPTKEWHSFAVTDTKSQEVYFYFCTGSDEEPSDYVIYSPRNGSFTLGQQQRTAACRSELNRTQYFANSMASDTAVYKHFTQGATTFDWFAETSFFYVEDGGLRFFVDEIRPDTSQSGDITVKITARDYPQGADIDFGTYTITPTTEFISTKAAGKYIRLRFSGSNEATLGNWTLNVRRKGAR